MGLFGGGKTCAVCGAKAGMLSRQKLRDDNFVCSDCQLKISDQFRTDDYRRMTLSQFNKCAEEFPAETEKLRTQFQETFSIYAGSGTSHKVLAADDSHGWWYCAEYLRPMLLKYDEVTSWNVRMDTLPDTDEDKKNGIVDMFASFAQSSYYASLRQNHPELPTCPPGYHVTRMDVYVSLSNPYLKEAVIDVWKPGWFTNQMEDMSNAYNTAIQIIEFFQRIKGQMNMGMGAYGNNYGANNYGMNQFQQNAGYTRAGQQPAPAQAAASDPTAELRKFKNLLDEGIISQEEFDSKKKQLLGL